MDWLTVILVAAVLGGVGWIWYQVFGDKNEVVSCCGCGECAHHGECIMVKKRAKKRRVGLTNAPKQI